MLRIASKIYSFFVRKRNRAFDTNQEQVITVKNPVISIGNISVGGTGKTPFTVMLAQEILKLGFKPAIIGRGYGRKNTEKSIISNGKEKKKPKEAVTDGYKMRRAAVDYQISLITNIQLAKAYIDAITSIETKDIEVKAWSEFK